MKSEPPRKTFECYICRGVFEKGWSDDEAAEEALNRFPDIDLSDTVIVCDDCDKRMIALLQTGGRLKQ